MQRENKDVVNKVEIDFDPATHVYKVNGEVARISVTALVDKQITKTQWGDIDPEILRRAADRGTKVHADCEFFIKDNTVPQTQECINYANYIKDNNWQIEEARTEFKLAIRYVSSDHNHSFILCGTADLMCKLNGKYIVADYKTTSSVHTEYVRWQMSLLDFMARQLNGSVINNEKFIYTPAEEIYCFHFDKQAKFTPIKVDFIPEVEIIRLLDAEASNQEYHPTPVDILTPRQQVQLLDLEKQICSLEATKKLLEKQSQQLRSELVQSFQAHSMTKAEFPSLSITYTPETTRTTFDTVKFKEDYPELYKQYCTTTSVKPKVTITLAQDVKQQLEAYAPTTAQISELPKPKRKNAKRGFFR